MRNLYVWGRVMKFLMPVAAAIAAAGLFGNVCAAQSGTPMTDIVRKHCLAAGHSEGACGCYISTLQKDGFNDERFHFLAKVIADGVPQDHLNVPPLPARTNANAYGSIRQDTLVAAARSCGITH